MCTDNYPDWLVYHYNYVPKNHTVPPCQLTWIFPDRLLQKCCLSLSGFLNYTNSST